MGLAPAWDWSVGGGRGREPSSGRGRPPSGCFDGGPSRAGSAARTTRSRAAILADAAADAAERLDLRLLEFRGSRIGTMPWFEGRRVEPGCRGRLLPLP